MSLFTLGLLHRNCFSGGEYTHTHTHTHTRAIRARHTHPCHACTLGIICVLELCTPFLNIAVGHAHMLCMNTLYICTCICYHVVITNVFVCVCVRVCVRPCVCPCVPVPGCVDKGLEAPGRLKVARWRAQHLTRRQALSSRPPIG